MKLPIAALSSQLDPSGIYGLLLHYSMVIVLVGGALIIFIQLWRKGKLDMDESPKLEMMQMDEKRYQSEKVDDG